VWREAAERCRERLKKGSPIYVEGRLRSTNWETKEGQKRSGIEVEAYRLQFLAKMTGGEDSPAGAEGESDPIGEPASVGAESSSPAPRGEPTSSSGSNDDIPF